MSPPGGEAQTGCLPIAADMEGPFYKPNAPRRQSTGRGLEVKGKVKSANSCAVISGARIEWWQANPKRKYDDTYRGTTFTKSDGTYRFETNFPPGYYGRPPHIHFKVFAPGHRTLTTQIYPQENQKSVTFDFILLEEGDR
jgi:protocatechuate 3,4-dioxygenase beta subunit